MSGEGSGKTASAEREIPKSEGKHWAPLLGMCQKGKAAVRGKEPHGKRTQDSLVSLPCMPT